MGLAVEPPSLRLHIGLEGIGIAYFGKIRKAALERCDRMATALAGEECPVFGGVGNGLRREEKRREGGLRNGTQRRGEGPSGRRGLRNHGFSLAWRRPWDGKLRPRYSESIDPGAAALNPSRMRLSCWKVEPQSLMKTLASLRSKVHFPLGSRVKR